MEENNLLAADLCQASKYFFSFAGAH